MAIWTKVAWFAWDNVWCQVRKETNGIICLNKLNETPKDGQVANNLITLYAKHIIILSAAINGGKFSVSNLIIMFRHFHRSKRSNHFLQVLIGSFDVVSLEGFIKIYGFASLTGVS